MPNSIFDAKPLRDEKAAYAYIESQIWPQGRVCPHCGVVDRSGALKGKSTRIGAYKCYACRKPFTVKIGTIFEDSHVPMHLWLQAIVMMCSSKKGISTNQLHRTLGVTLRTAWYLSHRIREAMKEDGSSGPLGGEGKIVEVDETYWGRKEGSERVEWQFSNDRGWNRGGKGLPGRKRVKVPIITLVERGGKARSIQAKDITAKTLRGAVLENAKTESALMTDELKAYRNIGKRFASHDTVNHSESEYARVEKTEDGDEKLVTTNTVEGYFGVFKRGMVGIYQHCNERHLHRYAAECDFRYNTRTALDFDDEQRTEVAIRGIIGKRLTYRTTRDGTAEAPAT